MEINHLCKVCAEQGQCHRLVKTVNQHNKLPECLHSLCNVATGQSQVPWTRTVGEEETTTMD